MKKISLILLVVTLLSSFTLVACGNKNEGVEKDKCFSCGKEIPEDTVLCEECLASASPSGKIETKFEVESTEMSEDLANTICTATVRCDIDHEIYKPEPGDSLIALVVKNVTLKTTFEFLDKDGVVVDCVEVYDEASECHHNQRITIVGKTTRDKGAVSCNVTVEGKMITYK